MRRHFDAWAGEAPLTVVEGVMGLYDGKRGEPFGAYSSASVAKRLGLPVLLLLNARQSGTDAGDPGPGPAEGRSKAKDRGRGPESSGQREELRDAGAVIRKLCGVPVLGWLPTLPALALPERHLGLAARAS